MTHESPKWAGTIWTIVGYVLILLCFAGLFFLAFRGGCNASAQTTAMPGDTIRVVAVARDSNGVATLPDAARLFVMRDGAVVDSTKYYPGGGLTAISNWNKALQGTYIVSGAGTFPIDLQFLMRYNLDGFLGDQAACSPSIVRVNPKVKTVDRVTLTDTVTELTEVITATVGVIDTLAPSAVEDLYQGIEANETFDVNTNDAAWSAYRVMVSGTPAAVGRVYLTNSSDLYSSDTEAKNTRVEAAVSNGHWRAKIPLHHALPDTVYVWAWTGTSWPSQGTMLVMEE